MSTTDQGHVVTFSVKCGGKLIDPEYVYSIDIDKQVNRIASCNIVLLDGKPTKQSFPISESSQFVPGGEVEVKAGYMNDNKLIFKGVLTRMGLSVDEETGPSLRLQCKDKAVKMTVGRKNAYFYKKTDKQIISGVIGAHAGLKAKVGNISGQLPEVIQYYVTDWDFILSRADHNGKIVTTEAGEVAVVGLDEVKDEVLEITYGKDMYSFHADMDAIDQHKKVIAHGWNIKEQKLIKGEASVSNYSQGNVTNSKLADVAGLKQYELQSTIPMTKGDLGKWAKAQSAKTKYAKIRGSVGFLGTDKALPAKLITIKGMGARFNGKALISGVHHEISDGVWITTVEMGLSPDWFTERVTTQAPLASGLLPGIQGLQVGKVKKIHEDPENQFRVQVDIPVANPPQKGVWARYAQPYASDGFGAFFYPQIGDEVILGFFNDDPRSPVILGSLYSSARKAPEKPDKDNSKQCILTRNKLKLEFNDKDKIITITTPGEHKLVLNEKEKQVLLTTKEKNKVVLDDKGKKVTVADQNKNSIVMSSSGIVIQSEKNLTLKAKQAVKIDAGSVLTAKAKQALTADAGTALNLKAKQAGKLEALQVSVKAKAKAEVKAGASMDLNGGANIKMKAAMIMIN